MFVVYYGAVACCFLCSGCTLDFSFVHHSIFMYVYRCSFTCGNNKTPWFAISHKLRCIPMPIGGADLGLCDLIIAGCRLDTK